MKQNAVLLFVLFAGALGFGGTPSQQDTAPAIKGVLRLRDGMRSPDNFQVSRVLITDKGVCIDYRSKNKSGAMSTGFAVYKEDKDTLWVDNSWIWQQACLFGKLAQRRDGTDVTEAARAALKGPQAGQVQPVSSAVLIPKVPAVPSLVVPVGVPVTSSQAAVAVAQPTPAVPAPVAPPAVPAASGATPVSVKAPVTPQAPALVATHPAEPPLASIQVVTVVPASPVTQSTQRPAVPAAVTSPPAAQRQVATVPVEETPSGPSGPAPAASPDSPTVHGVVISDPQGALGKPTSALPAPPQESLADVARRLKKAKQQVP